MPENNNTKSSIPQTEKIIDLLSSESGISEKEAAVIRRWLADPHNSDIKSEALVKKLSEAMQSSDNPVLGLETWPVVARRIGVDPDIVNNKHTADRSVKIPAWRKVVARVAAVLIPVAIAVGAWVAVNNTGNRAEQEITVSTSPGEVKEITLPDGSTVRIEPGTTLTYGGDFADNRRIAISGEALFDVAGRLTSGGERQPFTVTTNNITVNVLGTVFRVSEQEGANASTVALYQGSVNVENGGLTSLRHGDLYQYDHISGTHTIGVIPADEMLDNGQKPLLRFDNSSLGNLITALAANFGVEFRVAHDIDTTKGRFSGDLEGLPVDDALGLLTKSNTAYSFTREGDNIIVKRK